MASPGPTFATPLPQSSRSSILEWHFPKPQSHLVLTGKSRAAWHTSFIIPQLNLLLDAGLCVNNLRPRQIFLTHGHSDHTLLAPAFVRRENNPDIYCPEEMREVFDGFILANALLNLGGSVGVEGGRGYDDGDEAGDTDAGDEGEGLEEVEGNKMGNTEEKNSSEELDVGRGETSPSPLSHKSSSSSSSMASNHKPITKPRHHLLKTHRTHGLHPGSIVTLPHSKNMTATAFPCDHQVPCLGYVFSQLSQRLLTSFRSLPGPELARLRRQTSPPVQITETHSKPIFAFLGDTTAKTLAAEPDWLKDGIPVVITECSFLYPEHKAQADKTKHTLWCELEPVVRKFRDTTFVLMHFSLRYSDAEVRRFFRGMENCPGNIVVWVDGED